MKDCMFQLAIDGYMEVDTNLIEKEKAKELWKENKSEFIRAITDGDTAEMAIWINCENSGDYHTSIMHVDHNSIIKGTSIYEMTYIG